jgi:archaeal flagellar protein FlaJ
LKKIKTTSLIKNKIKKSNISEKDFEKRKINSLKISIFIGLFGWLICGAYTKEIFRSGVGGILLMIIVFALSLYWPIIKQKQYSKKVEADLPLFLSKLVSELRVGKDFVKALKNSCQGKKEIETEYLRVVKDFKNGSSISEALKKMNQRIIGINIKRANSSLNNIYLHGSSSDTLKKLTDDLLIRQKIESKEFSGKMVVYALVFIAVSAIMPSMFQSFILIGSYFMKISFTPLQVFFIIVLLFPALDVSILYMIHSKTPIFLRQ